MLDWKESVQMTACFLDSLHAYTNRATHTLTRYLKTKSGRARFFVFFDWKNWRAPLGVFWQRASRPIVRFFESMNFTRNRNALTRKETFVANKP